MTMSSASDLTFVAVGTVGVVALTITPADINTAIISITALVTALGIVIVNIMTARAAARQRAVQTAIVNETLAQTKVIEGHVNSANTKSAEQITALLNENALLREVLADKKEVASLLAQAAAVAAAHATLPTPTPPAALAGASPSASLAQIDTNTAAIERNTARTDATVTELKKDAS